jgi:hypothetical protein
MMQIYEWLRIRRGGLIKPAKAFLYVCMVLVCFSLLIFPFSQASAQSPLNFGGLVTWTFFCNCSYNFIVYIAPVPPKVNGFFSYRFTPQYANYRLPSPGNWALGLYSPGDVCLIWVSAIPPFCTPFIQPMGIITPTVGTSLGV